MADTPALRPQKNLQSITKKAGVSKTQVDKFRAPEKEIPQYDDVHHDRIREHREKEVKVKKNATIIGLILALFGGIALSQYNNSGEDQKPVEPIKNVNLAWIPNPYTVIQCSINNSSDTIPSCYSLQGIAMTGIRNLSRQETETVEPLSITASSTLGWKMITDKCSKITLAHGTTCPILFQIYGQNITKPGNYKIEIKSPQIPDLGGALIEAIP